MESKIETHLAIHKAGFSIAAIAMDACIPCQHKFLDTLKGHRPLAEINSESLLIFVEDFCLLWGGRGFHGQDGTTCAAHDFVGHGPGQMRPYFDVLGAV